MRLRFSRRGAGKAVVFVVLLMLVVGGSLAYRYLFHRPGEQAIQLIPADALAVITLDTNPSPAQAPAFNRIKKALEENGVSQKLESTISEAMQKSPVVAQVRQYAKTSFALAVLPNGGKTAFDGGGAMLVAVSDPGKVAELLEKHGTRQATGGLTTYRFAQDRSYATVMGDYLVVSPRAQDLAAIEAVRSGQKKSVATLLEYQEARAALPEDANLMVFLSPSAMKELNSTAAQQAMAGPWKSVPWFAMSATVRDAGIAVDYRMPMDQAKDRTLAAMASIEPLDTAMLGKLPGGAYGLFALSQPGGYWNAVRGSLEQQPEAAKGLNEGIEQFEKETGMSVDRDILPGLKGNLWLAAYPDTRGADVGVDGLIVIDDAHGADPAALAEKVRLYAEKASSENVQRRVTFQKSEKEGATVWSLDEKTASELRKGLAEAAGSGPAMMGAQGPPADFSPPNLDKVEVNAPGARAEASENGPRIQMSDPTKLEVQSRNPETEVSRGSEGSRAPEVSPNVFAAPGQPGKEAKRYAENKTIVYAQVGKAILIASSQEMLDRALGVYNGQAGSLAEDAAYSNMRGALPPGSQSVMMVDLGAIMRSLKPTIEKAMRDNEMGITADDIVNLFGRSAGLVAGGKYDGRVSTGTLFLPIDYERGIKSIGALIRSGEGAARSQHISWLRHSPAAIQLAQGRSVLLASR